jgi:multiple sugar transport system permease protein
MAAIDNAPIGAGYSLPAERAKRFAKNLAITALLCVMLYPLLWLVASALRPSNQVMIARTLIPDELRWQNFVDGWNAFGTVTFGRMLLNSTIVSVACIVGNLLSCSLAAYAFARLRFPYKRTLFFLMLATLMLPYHVQAIPQYIMFLNFGWVNTFLPLTVPKFFATDAFFVYLMVQFIRSLPRELDEAAFVDGAGHFTIFSQIILPLCMPALATTAAFTFIFTWNEFFQPLIYLTRTEMFTAPLGLRRFLDSETTSDYGPMFAMALVSLGPIFGFFIASQKYLTRGIATTGLK